MHEKNLRVLARFGLADEGERRLTDRERRLTDRGRRLTDRGRRLMDEGEAG